ncbi:ABC transporter ATP-binding protein [Streptacidiphilus albus]|uniref:ABC transporter ATP-binding protein n=1 Tax=Streptacidiphilus albus TaxID=105425 RepID=UPI0005AA1B75|nr:ABC transporter ATP-binding protein [Streptacidiphilus albus]
MTSSDSRTQGAATAHGDSEELLFGGPMRYDYGWAKHELASGGLTFWAIARQLPGMLRLASRMSWRADRTALIVLLTAEVLRGVASAVGLLATNRALRALLSAGTVHHALHTALPAVLLAGVVAGLSALMATASTWATGRLEPAVFEQATADFLKIVSRTELEAIEDPEFLSAVDSARFGATSVQHLTGQATTLLTSSFSLISVASVLSVLHPALLPMLLLICAPRGWGAVRTARRRYASRRAWLQHSRAAALLADMLVHPWSAAELRVHASGPFVLRHYEAMAAEAAHEQARLAGAKARTDVLTAALAGMALVGAYALLGVLVADGSMPLAVAGTAVLAIRSGSGSISTLVSQVNSLYEDALFVRDLDALHREGAERAIPTGGTELPQRPAVIRVEDVSFTYTGRDTPALDKVSLEIPRGTVVALVGDNGSGKSTLVNLLSGVYQPHAGRILWDGVDIAGADRDQLFSSVALFAQNFQRWQFTVLANLLLGRPEQDIGQEQLDASAAYADLTSVIEGLRRGWNTLVYKGFEGGVNLSGGQWQKVALARTHLRVTTCDPSGRLPHLVIVDEPTSALDARAEVEAFERIRELTNLGATVVLITHRLAATAKADHIYVLDHGRLIEQGTHEELMAQQPTTQYRESYLLQARQYQFEVPQQARDSRPSSAMS